MRPHLLESPALQLLQQHRHHALGQLELILPPQLEQDPAQGQLYA